LFKSLPENGSDYPIAEMRMQNRKILMILLLLCGLLIGGISVQAQPADIFSVFLPMAQRQGPFPEFDINLQPLVISAFNVPVEITHAGDDSNRLFIAEQSGLVRIFNLGTNQVLTDPFLDLQSEVIFGGEQGLLGLAFHPDYAQNGFFYVDYTRPFNDKAETVIARYQASASDPNRADPASKLEILTIPQPASNHNGGMLAFGPDGYLYIGMGDGGGAGDPNNYAQNPDVLLGKILRIDIDHGNPYTIPDDNPYVVSGGSPEIWSLGLRNPWRFSFDRARGDLWIGDVGQGDWEEINFQPAGSEGGINYGWRCYEGTHEFSTSPPCDDPSYLANLTMPVMEYGHNQGSSVTGGFVYRGSQYPSLSGSYFFADFGSGRIWSSYPLPGGGFASPELKLDTPYNISTFGEDESGELYLADYYNGSVYRVADAAAAH
jgi:glucose/arabinose dehydrogenase